MSIEFEIQPVQALVCAQFRGEITVAELRDYNLRLRAHPAFHPGLRELVELVGIRPQLDFRQLAQYRDWLAKLAPLGRTAIVAPDELAFGMARQFATLSGQGAERIRVFRDTAAARAWLSGQGPPPAA